MEKTLVNWYIVREGRWLSLMILPFDPELPSDSDSLLDNHQTHLDRHYCYPSCHHYLDIHH